MNEEVWHAPVFTHESEAAAGGRWGAAVLWPDRAAGEAAEFDVERSFPDRQDDGGGVAEPEEPLAEPPRVEWGGQKRVWWHREAAFQGRQGRRDRHESAMDPVMQQWRKSQTAEAKRSDLGYGPEEDRQGLIKTVRETPGVEQKCDAQRSYGT